MNLASIIAKHSSGKKQPASSKKQGTVSFVTKGGIDVSFSPKKKKAKRPDSQLTPFQLHMRKALSGQPKSKIPAIFKKAAKSFSKKK